MGRIISAVLLFLGLVVGIRVFSPYLFRQNLTTNQTKTQTTSQTATQTLTTQVTKVPQPRSTGFSTASITTLPAPLQPLQPQPQPTATTPYPPTTLPAPLPEQPIPAKW